MTLFGWFSKLFWNEEIPSETEDAKEDDILEEYLNSKVNITEETLTGIVTNFHGDLVEIDNRYVGMSTKEFKVGEEVIYTSRKSKNNEIVTEISPLDTDREKLESYISLTGFIEKREGSFIFVNNVSYSLEGVESDFVPCTGDKVNLTVCESTKKCEKNYILVEINPHKKFLFIGQITKWDGFEGIINDNIFFNRNYCNISTSINVGDRVLASLIDTNKDDFQYRAIYIEISKKRYNTKSIFVEEITNIFIIKGQEKYFEVNLFNLSNKWQHISSFSMEPHDDVITLVNPIGLRSIPPETCIPYKFCLKPLFSDKVLIKLLWTFNRFTLGRSFTIKVLGIANDNTWDSAKDYSQSQIVLSAPSFSRKPNFRLLPLDAYNVPQNLKNLNSHVNINDVTSVIFELQSLVPSILNELSYDNYRRNFHTLLYLEEVTTIGKYSELNIVTALNKRGEDIVLKLDSETPHFDMLSFGDKISASVIWDENILFEGVIRDISASEIVARFHPKIFTDFSDGRLYKIKFKPSRVHFRRQHQAVDICLSNLEKRLFPKCVSGLFDYNLFEASKSTWVNSDLNEEQKNAIINILKQEEGEIPYVIFGPPGSGKTVTIVELILQIVKLQPFSKILVAAPSNSAVDAIGLALVNSGILMKQQILRLGSLRYFLRGDQVVGLNEVTYFLSDSPKDIIWNIPLIDYDSLGKHNVTLGTFSTIGLLTNIRFRKRHFSHIIIDEAGQVTEPESLIPLRALSDNGGNIVVCGDPLQLGPVIFSKVAAVLGLQKSFLSRLVDKYPYLKDVERFPNTLGYDPRILTKLVLNYRALPELVNMSSSLFYNNELKPTLTEDSPEAKLLERIKLNFKWDQIGSLLFHHVSGEEEQPAGSTSWINIPEAMKVAMFLVKLYSSGVSPDEIGVITPYKKQLGFISQFVHQLNILPPKLGSVEEFQGLEKQIIILSLVRSVDSNPNSFINEPRRINVASSRAKTLLLIVGNKHVLIKNQIWKQMLDLCQEINY